MDFGTSIKTCFSKYATFSGRARRSEFWWFFLFSILGSIVAAIIDAAIGSEMGAVGNIFSLALFLPSLAVGSRRLHDINKSGWWQILPLVGFVPMLIGIVGIAVSGGGMSGISAGLAIIGGLLALGLYILCIVWWATDGDAADNRFGVNPKTGQKLDDVFS